MENTLPRKGCMRLSDILPRRHDASSDSCTFRQQLHDRPAEHGLAAAGFSHHGQDFTRMQRERNTAHRMKRALRSFKVHFQILYLQNRISHFVHHDSEKV